MDINDKILDYNFFKKYNQQDNFNIIDKDYLDLLDDNDKLFDKIIGKSEEESNIILNFNGDENSFYNYLDLNDILSFRKKIFGVEKKIDKINFFTISSKESFNDLLITDDLDDKVWNDSVLYFPLNDHSRVYLKKGDVLFCNRIGQFENLSEALNTRGIYGVGIALTDPIEFFPEEEGHNKYGVIVSFPLSLKKSLSTRNIQMNPVTIDLTPYNGNRNDALQWISERDKAIELLKMISFNNPNISNLFKIFYDFEIPKIDILPSDYLNLKFKNENKKAIIIEDSKLKNIIFMSFQYLLKIYEENEVLKNYELKKDVLTGDKKYDGIKLEEYFGSEVLLSVFQNEQNIEDYKSKGNKRFINSVLHLKNYPYSYFTSQWNESNGRGLSLYNFNKLLNDVSKNTLEIIKEENIFKLIEKNRTQKNSPLKPLEQKIFFGSPGTGKSYKVDQIISELNTDFYERVTFHPEFDNASFVGGYKPVSDKDGGISYKFVPQAFTNIYERAWLDPNNQYYLVIEEINRGNCAEIFGDIFQLLDRNSNYTVSPSEELKNHLIEKFGKENQDGIANGLKLPPNLTIYATMNTSDQSLFPMDSAFKRRWEWEYVPINYEEFNDDGKPNDSFQYKVFLDDEKAKFFKWIDFIKNVNLKIEANENLGMDKCIGNYFIKSDTKEISLHEFINKVIFYLWNDVFKDEDVSKSIFEKGISFEKFFPINKNALPLIEKILAKINVEILPKAE